LEDKGLVTPEELTNRSRKAFEFGERDEVY